MRGPYRLSVPFVFAGLVMAFGQEPPRQGLLDRRYSNGEKLIYRMRGNENGRSYTIRASGVVVVAPLHITNLLAPGKPPSLFHVIGSLIGEPASRKRVHVRVSLIA